MQGGFGQFGADRQKRERKQYEEALRNEYYPVSVVANQIYVFTKSGNKVKAIIQTGCGEWQVERVDTGKGMIVNERALMTVEDWEKLSR